MSTTARRRLMRDFKRLQEDPPEGVSGAPGENNIMVWNAVIFGPHETPFEDGTFKLMVRYHPKPQTELENYRSFLPLRFYVKSIIENRLLKFKKCHLGIFRGSEL